MTEEYKINLINYVTGLLNEEQPQEQDFNITNINGIDYTSEEWQFIIDEFRQMDVAINGILEDEKYDIFIMYGGYQLQAEENSKGFLIYLDKNGVPFKILKTNYRGFIHLDYDDETNRVYGIVGDKATYFGSTTNDVYFVYFNNLFLVNSDNFSVIQTYAYKIYSNPIGVDKIIKDPQASNYLIIGRTYVSTRIPVVIELKINVGSSNEINIWTVDTPSINYTLCGAYGWYENGQPDFKLICLNISNTTFVLVRKNGSSLTYTNLAADHTINRPQTAYIHSQYIGINQNEIYFVFHEDWYNSSVTINYRKANLLKYNGTSIEFVYQTNITEVEKEGDEFQSINIPMLNIINDVDNTLYLLEYINNEDEQFMQLNLCNLTNNPNADKWEDLGTWYSIYRVNIFNERVILRRNYNIANIFSFSGYFRTGLGNPTGDVNGSQINIQNLAPINGYIGNPYTGVDCLVPLFSNLCSNSLLIFSRNLYNISKQNNMSMSSVEIPNNYLNGDVVSQNDLISKTNIKMNEIFSSWTKNIYEVVDLNFLNTIRVIDEDTNTEYLESAIKVNNATTDGGDTNYQNTPCNKYRINYSDNTTSIGALVWNSINNYNKKTQITFYVDKEINSIDLISNDETTIYLTIPVEATIGSYYTINQKVRTGDKPTPVQLQYNNEDINYNNQPVMVYVEE